MKKSILLVLGLFIFRDIYSQQVPTNTQTGTSAVSSPDYWSRVGNSGYGNNLFGTLWNSPIYTVTGNVGPLSNIFRMKLNAIFGNNSQYPIDGYNTYGNSNTTLNTTGYLLLGNDGSFQTSPGQTIYENKGAFSLLHLNGPGLIQQNGYRPWMKTGITLTGNQDLSYFGLRQIGTDVDWTETVLLWSDNQATGADEMAFRFTGASTSSTSIDNNLRSNVDLDGLHVARYTADGRYALGNTFGYINAPGHPTGLYARPQSLFHMSYDRQQGTLNEAYGFMQITYRNPTALIGAGETESDGLRIGIDNEIINSPANSHLNAYLRWQEASSFVIQTENDNTPDIEQNERMRITSTGALALNQGPNYGGVNTPTNVTRISISREGTTNSALTQPLSLLHLGYNLGEFTSQLTNFPFSNGYRSWMDLGAMVSNKTDHVWLGLKPENNSDISSSNRMDAVLAWGDNGNAQQPNLGADVFRFIFTAYSASQSDSPQSRSQEGLEIMRMYPDRDTTSDYVGLTYGRVGIGDFTTTGVNEQPTHKLDVVGNGRFRSLPDSLYLANQQTTKFVMVDEQGVLRWTQMDTTSGFGATCEDTVGALFTEHRNVDLNNYNFYFEGNNPGNTENNVGFGYNCGDSLKAKVDVIQRGTGGYGGRFLVIEDFVWGNNNLNPTGVLSVSTGNGNNEQYVGYTGVSGIALGSNSQYCYGVYGSADNGNINRAGYFNGLVDINGVTTSDSTFKRNIAKIPSALKLVSLLSPKTFVYDTLGYGQFNFDSKKQYGFIAQEVETILPELIHQSMHPGKMDSLGNIVGQPMKYKSMNYNAIIPINTQAIKELNTKVDQSTLSDQSLKTNVQNLENSLDKVLQMRGVTFDWDATNHPDMEFDSTEHVGFIAQEMNQIEPKLTFVDEDTLMHVDYMKVVPVLAEAIQELNGVVEAKDSVITALQSQNLAQQVTIDDLNDRLTQLENCLSNILPLLCQMNNTAIQPTLKEVQDQLSAVINVNLSDKNSIVLNQNVPNPFAESTVITYSVPLSVLKAQIQFNDGQGKLIKTVDISERGNGQLNVFANDLSSGVYTYTLVADGQIIATKRMVKQ
jgi:hypothetical protein